jgi:hypothetical protein
MTSSNAMRQLEERHVATKVELMVWSNKMDLLALSNVRGKIPGFSVCIWLISEFSFAWYKEINPYTFLDTVNSHQIYTLMNSAFVDVGSFVLNVVALRCCQIIRDRWIRLCAWCTSSWKSHGPSHLAVPIVVKVVQDAVICRILFFSNSVFS